MKRMLLSFLLIALTLMPAKAMASSAENIVLIPVKTSIEEIREIKTFSGHTNDVTSVSFSPDGKYALSGSDDNTLKLWEIETGREIRTLSGHTDSVTSVSFSPDGKYALSGSDDNTLKLWDIETGREIRTLSGHTKDVTSVSFSPDGRYALSGSFGTLKLWDIETGKEIKTFSGHTDSVTSVSFSPDGKYALSAESWDKTLKLWDIETGREIRIFKGHYARVSSVSFSPDGRYALSGSGDNTLKLWEIETGKEIRRFAGHTGGVNSVSFSPDGKYALSGSHDNTLKLWEIETGKEIRRFAGHTGAVYSVSFSPDGKYILSGSNDNTLKLWEIGISGINRALALSSVLTKISSIKVDVLTKINSMEAEREEKIKTLFTPKGEFETTKEYEVRTASAKAEEIRIRKEYDARIKEETWKEERRLKEEREKLYPYTLPLSLSKYDADTGGFDAEVKGNKVFIPVPREKAIEMSKDKDKFDIQGMVRYYDSENVELVNAFLVVEQTNSRFAFGKHTEAVMTASAQQTPPDLKISSIAFSEPSGNNILDAGETGKIKVALKNSGKGAGFGVSLSLAPTTSFPKGVQFSEKTYIGQINSGEEKAIEVEITGSEEVQTSEINLKATLAESNGFDSQPVILAFKAKELVPPLLQISKIDIQDSEGKRIIAKGKEVNLTLSVQNAGSGPARGVVAEIVSKSPDVKIFGDNKVAIGMLNPGESRKAVFNMAVTQRYSGEKTLPVSFAVKEERERFSILPDIRLALNEEAPEIKVVTVAAREMTVITAADTGDIETVPTLEAGQKVIGENDMAVVIGIERYRNLPKSDFSYNDAKLVKAYLKAMGFAERNIDYLTDDGATRSGIEKTVEGWLPNRVKKDSRVFIYYSGHGSPDPVTGEAYLVPHDGDPNYLSTTGYPLKRFYDKLGKLQVAEVMVVLDSCFSGAGGRSVLAKGARPALAKIEDPILASQNIAVLSSTQGTQISTSFSEKEHGLFTYYFLKAIKEGKKDLAEIYGYIKPIVEDEAKMLNVQQTPGINPDAEKLKGRFSLRK